MAVMMGAVLWCTCSASAQTPQELLAVHEGMNNALNAHDVDEMMAYFTDDAVEDVVALPPPATGKAEVAAFFAGFFKGFPDLNVTQRRILVSGNIMVTECTMTGTHQGEWMGIPPTGKRIQHIHMDVLEYEGTKIKRATLYADLVSLMVQLGVMPASELPPFVPSFTLPAPEPTTLPPLEAFAEANARWNAHDVSGFAKLVHPNADYMVAALGVPMNRDAFVGSQEMYLLAFPDLGFETSRSLDLGDGWVLSEVVISGTQNGPYFGIPPTGRRSRVRAALLARFEAGLLTREYIYFDRVWLFYDDGVFGFQRFLG
jgi:steroid delta-isomerase-like uncharacterized protein